MQLGIAEVLTQAEKAPDTQSKIAVLRENISRPLLDILIGAYDERVEWLLPKGEVPYRPSATSGSEGMLYSQTRTLYLYTKNGGAPDGLTQNRRELSFIQLLESVDPQDAKLLVAMKDKTLPYPSLTPKLIMEAFPNLIFRSRGVEQTAAPSMEDINERINAAVAKALSEAAESRQAMEVANKTHVESVPRKRHTGGWPKGKSRGPRNPDGTFKMAVSQPPPIPQVVEVAAEEVPPTPQTITAEETPSVEDHQEF